MNNDYSDKSTLRCKYTGRDLPIKTPNIPLFSFYLPPTEIIESKLNPSAVDPTAGPGVYYLLCRDSIDPGNPEGI
jgi:hypothetical protein